MKKIRVYIFLLVSLCMTDYTRAQPLDMIFKDGDLLVGARLGAVVQKKGFADIGIGVARFTRSFSIAAASVGLEYNVFSTAKGHILGPKIDLSYYAAPIEKVFFVNPGVKLSMIFYSNLTHPEKKQDIRLSPELVFSFLGLVDIHGGYNIPLGRNELEEIGQVRIAFSCNVPIANLK